jgi:glycosyltransferase involved in cell wall biosynthesis
MTKPLVSVMILTFNSLPHIKNSLESIWNQGYDPIEVIVVDGGSSDGTVEWLETEASGDVDLYLGYESVFDARNKAIEESSGAYIAVQDSDVVSKENRLSTQVEYLEENPSIGIVGSSVIRSQPNTQRSWVEQRESRENKDLSIGLYFNNQIVHPSVMIRREVIDTVGGYRDYLYEDYELLTRIDSKYKIDNIEQPLVCVMDKPGSYSEVPLYHSIFSNTVCGMLWALRSDFLLPLRLSLFVMRPLLAPFVFLNMWRNFNF